MNRPLASTDSNKHNTFLFILDMPKRKNATYGTKPQYRKKSRYMRGRRYKNKGLRGPKVFSLVRLASTNLRQSQGIGLRTNLAGYPEFYSTTNPVTSADNIQFIFTMAGVQVTFNGATGFTATLPGMAGDMGQLFDNYMIDKIDIYAMATWNGNQVSGQNVIGQLPYIIHAFDPDDANATSSDSIMQKTGAKYTQICESRSPIKLRTIQPMQASMIYNTLTTTAYAPKRGFVDMVNTTVPHYGYKLALDNVSLAAAAANTVIGNINFVFKYHLKLRFLI